MLKAMKHDVGQGCIFNSVHILSCGWTVLRSCPLLLWHWVWREHGLNYCLSLLVRIQFIHLHLLWFWIFYSFFIF